MDGTAGQEEAEVTQAKAPAGEGAAARPGGWGKFFARFRSKVAAKDRVPTGQKIAYGLGGPVEGTAQWVPMANLTPVYNIGLHLNPALIGVVLMIWRGWDALIDPVMGNISDNTRTRWGRRRPYIVAGAILTGLTLPIMWWAPPGMGQWATFAWLLLSGLIFYTCYTVWAMPYYSLQLEMSPDYDERTNITAYRAFPQKLMGMFSAWVIALATLPVFGTLADGSPDIVNGMRYLSLGLAVVTIALGVIPGIFVQERYYAKETSKQAKQPLIAGLKQTLSTRPFLLVLGIVLTKTFGFGLVSTLGFYVNAYYVCRGDIQLAATIMGIKAMVMFGPNLFAIPFCTWLSSRFDKKFLLYLVAVTGIVGNLSILIFYTPENPWLQIVPPLFIGPVSMGLWLVVPAMQADVADYDELFTGKRREGSFSAVFSWTYKVSTAMTMGISGVVLVLTGFDIDFGANQPPHVLENLRNCYVFIPLGFLLLNIYLVSRYSLTRERMAEIRAELERRRGVI